MTTLLFWLYGISAIGAVCNLPAWKRLFVAQWKKVECEKHCDPYLVIRGGMVLGAIGIGGVAIARMAEIIGYPVPAWTVVLWIIPIALAEAAFLWTAALQSGLQTPARLNPAWRIYLVAAAVWTLAIGVWAL